jgi:hypothetical protein
MHSMLGLAASDLLETGAKNPELKCSAIAHRLKAVRSLKETLVKGSHTFEEANAIVAALFNLLFQACHFDDGMTEFMTFIRGAVLVGSYMGCHRIRFLFNPIMAEEQLAKLEPGLNSAPTINSELVNAAIVSLEAFEPLCQRDYEKSFFNSLLQTARTLLVSPRDCERSSDFLLAHYGLADISRQHMSEYREFTANSHPT